MNGSTRKLIGVLGGMGPLATVDFLAKVVAATSATCDQEHVALMAYQLPQIPDRSAAILKGSDAPFAPMLSGLQRLASAGAQLAVIPCNTAHHWYDRLSNAQPLRILHIADAVKRELQQRSPHPLRPAILATRGTLRSRIYEDRLGTEVAPVALDEAAQTLVDEAIRAVKCGQRRVAAQAAHEAAERALALGAQVLILACTELPVAMAEDPLLESCVDSTLALARLCVAESTDEELLRDR